MPRVEDDAGDLPTEFLTKMHLTVNLQTAKALNLTVSAASAPAG